MSTENKRLWGVDRKQICGETKRDILGLPLCWLLSFFIFLRQNLEESKISGDMTWLWFGNGLTRCVKASVGVWGAGGSEWKC